MRNVETIFVVHPDLREEAVQSVLAASTKLVRSSGGELISLDDWGNKKLAYPIEKITRGRYFHMIYSTGETTIDELERNFRLSDRVYRYLTVALGDTPIEVELSEEAVEKLGEIEKVEPDFGSGGIEHLLREPAEILAEQEGTALTDDEGRPERSDAKPGDAPAAAAEGKEAAPAASAAPAAETAAAPEASADAPAVEAKGEENAQAAASDEPAKGGE